MTLSTKIEVFLCILHLFAVGLHMHALLSRVPFALAGLSCITTGEVMFLKCCVRITRYELLNFHRRSSHTLLCTFLRVEKLHLRWCWWCWMRCQVGLLPLLQSVVVVTWSQDALHRVDADRQHELGQGPGKATTTAKVLRLVYFLVHSFRLQKYFAEHSVLSTAHHLTSQVAVRKVRPMFDDVISIFTRDSMNCYSAS